MTTKIQITVYNNERSTKKEILWPGNKRDTNCFVLSRSMYLRLYIFPYRDTQKSQYPEVTKISGKIRYVFLNSQ